MEGGALSAGTCSAEHFEHTSTLCLPEIMTCDEISQAFRLHICLLKVIKYWKWQKSGNEAKGSIMIRKIISKLKMVKSHTQSFRAVVKSLLTSATAFSLGLTADRQTDRQCM